MFGLLKSVKVQFVPRCLRCFPKDPSLVQWSDSGPMVQLSSKSPTASAATVIEKIGWPMNISEACSGSTARAVSFFNTKSVLVRQRLNQIGFFVDVFRMSTRYTCEAKRTKNSGPRRAQDVKCPSCGHVENADVNASFNIAVRRVGVSRSAADRDAVEGSTDTPREATAGTMQDLGTPCARAIPVFFALVLIAYQLRSLANLV